MSVTAKGKRWETLHSLWIGWTFTLFLGWLAFVYIGLRARRPRWALWGLVYLFPLVLPSIIGINYTELSQWHWTETLALLVWVASIIHAFMIRKEYLLRLEALPQMKNNFGVKPKWREVRRIPLPRTRMNKATRRARAPFRTPAQ